MEKTEINYSKCIIVYIDSIIKHWIENGYQDKQWFLDFKDELNRLSIDEDRKDSK